MRREMLKGVIARKVGMLALLAWLLLSPGNSGAFERNNCEHCRRFCDSSPCAVRVNINFEHNHSKTLNACCPFCILERLEDYAQRDNAEIGTIMIVLFEERDETAPVFTSAERCWYLYGLDSDEYEGVEPIVAAFRSKRQAQAEQENLGGEVLDWDAVYARVKKLTDKYEPRNKNKDFEKVRPY